MIVVNLDIMMARRKMSLGELAEKILHPRGNLPNIGLPAGGYSGISGGGMIFL